MKFPFAMSRRAMTSLFAAAFTVGMGVVACTGDTLVAPTVQGGAANKNGNAPPLTAACTAINAVAGVAITPVTLVATGQGPFSTVSFTATGLPDGITISSTGTISGTPTVTGIFPYVVTLQENFFGQVINTGTVNCSLTVIALPSASCVTINAVQGTAITAVQLVGTGGTGGPYTFTATGLPAGLTLATDGTIAGTPTASGTFPYVVTIKDKDGNTGTLNCSLTVSAGPTATCVTINAVQGSPITPVTLVGGGGTGGPYLFSATGLPAGLTMGTDGSITGIPTVSGTFAYVVTIKDKDGNVGTLNCSVTVAPAPSAACLTLTAIMNSPITSAPMVGSGGTGGPYTFSATGLPTGLSMGTDGTISGTPTVSGTFSYTVTVKDKDGHAGTVNCSLTVGGAPTASCVTIVAVNGSAITPVTMVGSGGTGAPYTFAATGLPAGLTMSAGGTISGTPTVAGTFNYTVTVTDKDGHTGTVNCAVTVLPTPSATCVVISAVMGNPIAPVTMVGSGGTGGPYTFTATGLPTGLSMASNGTISGTPSVTGTFGYTVTVTDNSGHSGTVTCSVTVYAAPTANCAVIVAVAGSPITPTTLVAGGGTGAPYTFSATGLPAGLTMAPDGTISGTPSATGTFSYTVTIRDKDNNVGTINCSISVLPAPTASCVSLVAIAGSPITAAQMTGSGGTGGPYTFSATGLPAGLSMASDGTISGTPTVTGTFNYTVTVKDKDGHAGTVNCAVTVGAAPGASCLTISAVAGSAITPVTMIGSGGTGGAYTFSATGLPTGLSMASNGTISGTPTVTGTFNYTVTVTDKDGHTGTVNCSVTVNAAPSASCVTINAVMGNAVTPATMIGTGGTGGPYTFSATGLPAGLSMASDGTISGTANVSGTFPYTVTVTDKDGHVGTVNCSVTVYAAPTASCVAISAVAGSPITPVTMVGGGGTGGPYSFSATGLPSGLSMAPNGTISGTPTVTGTFSYTVTVSDHSGNSGTVNCSVTVSPAPSTSCVTIVAVQNSPITPVTMVGAGGTGGPYTFTASGLPSGLSMASNGTISGTPTVSGTFPYTVTVTDHSGNSSTINCSVTVLPPPTASCVTIAAVAGGLPITPVQLVGSGGTGGPYTFSATGLPTGLTMASNGTISGTPTVSGTFTYTVTITDNTGHSGTINCTVTIFAASTASCVTITAIAGSPIVPVTMVGSGGAGGPYTFSATGLPNGLSMSSSGTISGTPTVTGTFSYTVTIVDHGGNTSTTNCSVTVAAAPSTTCVTITAIQNVAITPATMVGGGGTGGPYTFSATGLPAGLTMASNGTISGTPTVSGTFPYTVTVKDNSGNSGTINCSVTVSPPPATSCVTITAVQGVAITSVQMVGSGGTGGPYTFSATGLPTGLTMASNGTISGTPTVNGTFSYTVTVTDKDGHNSTINCSVTVSPPPSTSCVTIVDAVKGMPITSVQLVGTGGAGGPYTFSATGLPTGLTMSASGVISGTPTVSGTFTYTVTVKDKNNNSATLNCTVVVNPQPSCGSCVTIDAVSGIAITPITLVGSGGAGGPYTFSATGLPAGLTISTSGTISGTPTVSGTFNYTVTVRDKNGNGTTSTCSVVVLTPPTCPSCPTITAVRGTAITPVTVTGSGGAGGPYTFSATGLPTGLTMSSSGTISGTPTVSGTFSYTVSVTDKNGHVGSFNCSVTVTTAPPSASCVSITAWKGGTITPVTLTGAGGAGGPYTFSATGLPTGLTMSSSGTISGKPTVSGTFTYHVTITDKNGTQGTLTCTITVRVDTIAPYCSVFEEANPPYMSYQDDETGIVRLDVTTNLNTNFKVGLTGQPSGTTYSPSITSLPFAMPTGTVITFPFGVLNEVDVSGTRVNTRESAQLTVKATDGAGNTVTCDPVQTTITRLNNDNGNQEFDNLPYAEHMVTIDNGGLKSVDLIVNGNTIHVKRLDDTEVRTVDVSQYMNHNRNNTIILVPKGNKGETADVTIGPPNG